jgi:DNA-binding beta-propeller fold protein YncE
MLFHFYYEKTLLRMIKRISRIAQTLPIIAAFILASCATHVEKQKTQQTYIVYPAPPDTARIQFLTSISSSDNTTMHKSSFSRFVIGDDETKTIKKPYGVTIRNGKIYVCDTGLEGIEIIDLEKKTFDFFVPTGNGQLKLPLNCSVDGDEKLYVADGERKQVIVFDKDRNYITSFGPADNFKPTDVYAGENKIWVVNLSDHCVQVFDKNNYSLLSRIPEEAASGDENYLYQPTNLYVTDDRIYVSDMGDFKVKIFTLDGKLIRSIGSQGTQVGQFVRPKGIAVDRDSNLFAVDASFENVQVFNDDGKLLVFFGGPYKGPGDLWLPAKVAIDYDNTSYFKKYADPAYDLKYIILVTSQYGPDKLNVYGAIEPAGKN